MPLENPHKIAKKDGHLHEIAKKDCRLPYLLIWGYITDLEDSKWSRGLQLVNC